MNAAETAQLEEISAGRIKLVKPEIVEYRKPKSTIAASFPAIGTTLKYSMIGALLMGLVVAFFVVTGAKLMQAPAPARAARTAEPVQKRTFVSRRINHAAVSAPAAVSNATAVNHNNAVTLTAPGAGSESGPVLEYKGPSSVTGAAVPHRRAYQTSALEAVTH